MTEAFVTAVGLPARLDEFCAMVADNLGQRGSDACFLDLEHLLNPAVDRVHWSAPPWSRPGDVAIFYCTQRAARTASTLRQQMPARPTWVVDGTLQENLELREVFLDALSRAERLLAKNAGRFISVGRVTGLPEKGWVAHVRDRTFTTIADLFRLQTPIPLDAIASAFTVRRAATITRMGASAFNALLASLREQHLPKWVSSVRIGLDAILDQLRGDWRNLVRSDLYRPKTEDELRELIVHPILEEISDAGAPVLHECRCYHRNRSLGIVDSLVKLNGRWVPVESKLRVASWDDVMNQVRRYQLATRAVPMLGSERGSSHTLVAEGPGLVIDSDGITVIGPSSSPDAPVRPFLPLDRLSETRAGELRDALLVKLVSPNPGNAARG